MKGRRAVIGSTIRTKALALWMAVGFAVAVLVSACSAMQEHRDTVGGAVIGCVGGYAACVLLKRNPTVCAAACAVGGLVGASFGAYLDHRRHAVEQAAREARLNVSLRKVAVSATVASAPGSSSAANLPGQGGRSPSQQWSEGGARSPSQQFSAGSTGASPAPSENGLLAEIGVDGMFPTGSAEPTPAARAQLSHFARAYRGRNDANGARVSSKLLITGHTDSSGVPSANQQLSEQRARAVARILVEQGIPPSDLYIKGAGSSQPVAENRTPEGRARNRRVGILEIDNEQNLVAFDNARRQDRRNLSYSTVTPASSDQGVVGTPGAGSVRYGFGGEPAQKYESDLLRIDGPPPRHFQWELEAAPAAGSIGPCYLDQPRVDGDILHYADNSKVESHSTARYMPGLFGTGWEGSVGQSMVGFGPVAVLRDDARPVGNPTVFVEPPQVHAAVRYAGVVNTYDGEYGVFYRVYIRESASPVQCFDVALPKQGQSASVAGWLFYRDDRGWRQASFHPALVSNKS